MKYDKINLDNYDFLLTFTNATGFGDNYGCIISAANTYKILSNNFKVAVISNSEYDVKLPGNPSLEIYKNFFNYDLFGDNVFFNVEIDLNFNHILNVNHSHHIYVNKLKNLNTDNILNNLNICGYSHELIFNKKINTPIELNSMINNEIEREIQQKYGNIKNIIGFHIRIHDGKYLTDDFKEKVVKKINNIIINYPNYNFIISGKGISFLDFGLKNEKIINIKRDQNGDLIDFLKKDLKEMCLYSYCSKIYSYGEWRSAFLTYAILHNRQKINYNDLVLPLLE